MFSKKEFNKHPYTLIHLACLSEAMMYFAVWQMNFPCDDFYNFKKVMAITTGFTQNSPKLEYHWLQILHLSDKF